LAAGVALLVILVAALLSFLYYRNVQTSLRLGFSDRLRDLAGVIASQVDGDLHASLVDSDQKFSNDYNLIRRQFLNQQGGAPDIVFIYTLRLVGEDVVFVVDSDPNPTNINEVYDDVSDFARAQFAGISAPIADTEFYTDKWGTFLSGYAPIYNARGELDAILAVDMDATTVVTREQEILVIMLTIVIPLVLIFSVAGFFYGRLLARSILQINAAARQLTAGDLSFRVKPRRGWASEIFELGQVFNSMADRLSTLLETQEKLVAERTADANRRTQTVQAAAEVAAITSTIVDPERLLRQVVDLIRDRFDLYYVGLFLVDASGEWVVLRAGTGEAGANMLARGHRIAVGQGMIGWSVANAQARIALEVGEDNVRLVTSELPFTRSEAAIPLRARGEVLGALTVQSSAPNAFDQPTLFAFQTMADQIGIALSNARLIRENQEALETAQRAYQQLTQRSWVEFVKESNRPKGYKATERSLIPVHSDLDRQDEGAMRIPVRVRGVELGTIVAAKPAGRGEWRVEEKELMQDFAEQISAALENARLYSETQRSAERERILSEITSIVRGASSVDAILQNAVRELALALDVPQAAIRLYSRRQQPPAAAADQPAAPKLND
jgi:GAF domain-containing protein